MPETKEAFVERVRENMRKAQKSAVVQFRSNLRNGISKPRVFTAKQREAVLLYAHGMGIPEIATALKITHSCVYDRLNYAAEALTPGEHYRGLKAYARDRGWVVIDAEK